MEINCPSCNEELIIPDSDLNDSIECPFCLQKILVEQDDEDIATTPNQQQPKNQGINQESLQPSSNELDHHFKLKDGETVYFKNGDMVVTNKRLSAYNHDICRIQDIPLKTITSASATSEIIENESPPMSLTKLLYVFIAIGGGLLALIGFLLINANNPNPALVFSLVIAGVILFGAGFRMQSQYQVDTGEEIFLVHIHQLGVREGDEINMLCDGPEEAIDIQNAINQAVIDST